MSTYLQIIIVLKMQNEFTFHWYLSKFEAWVAGGSYFFVEWRESLYVIQVDLFIVAHEFPSRNISKKVLFWFKSYGLFDTVFIYRNLIMVTVDIFCTNKILHHEIHSVNTIQNYFWGVRPTYRRSVGLYNFFPRGGGVT